MGKERQNMGSLGTLGSGSWRLSGPPPGLVEGVWDSGLTHVQEALSRPEGGMYSQGDCCVLGHMRRTWD